MLNSLPKDLGYYLLEFLDIKSIARLSETCRYLHTLTLGQEESICKKLFQEKFPRAQISRTLGGVRKFKQLNDCYKVLQKAADILPEIYSLNNIAKRAYEARENSGKECVPRWTWDNIVYEMSGKLLHSDDISGWFVINILIWDRLNRIPGCNIVVATDTQSGMSFLGVLGMGPGTVNTLSGSSDVEVLYKIVNGSTLVITSPGLVDRVEDLYIEHKIEQRVDLLVLDRESVENFYNRPPSGHEGFTRSYMSIIRDVVAYYSPDVFAVGRGRSIFVDKLLHEIAFDRGTTLTCYTRRNWVVKMPFVHDQCPDNSTIESIFDLQVRINGAHLTKK